MENVGMLPTLVKVESATNVAEVRRIALGFAGEEGLSGARSEEVAIIATEISTNILKHATSGEVLVSPLSSTGEAGVEILSIDRGPGMASIQACIADGYSSAGTSGTGLGAITRLADVYDGYSQVGRGTILMTRKYAANGSRVKARRWTFGAVRVPYPGESMCGDHWGLRREGDAVAVLVADGLGHGVLAADASTAAVLSFRGNGSTLPVPALERIHRALRSTRGAAVAVSYLPMTGNVLQFSGLGNIAGVLLGGARQRYMVSHNGTAGMEARRFQAFDYPMTEETSLVMHSDGLNTSWTLDAYPGLMMRHPSVIAGILYRDANRGRDDVCVVVGRNMIE